MKISPQSLITCNDARVHCCLHAFDTDKRTTKSHQIYLTCKFTKSHFENHIAIASSSTKIYDPQARQKINKLTSNKFIHYKCDPFIKQAYTRYRGSLICVYRYILTGQACRMLADHNCSTDL